MKNSVPLPVTVIIPAYKAAGTIRRSLDSVLAQTSPPSEVLVVDDGSPDRAQLRAVLAPYGSVVTLLQKPNGGAASARNYGIDQARGEWIALLDADDYWEPSKLERQFQVIEANPGVGLVGCSYYEEEPGKPRTLTSDKMSPYCGRLLHSERSESFDAALVVWTSTLVIRRDLLAGHRFVTDFETAEDRDLWIRLFSAGSAYLLPDFLATYVQEPGGTISNESRSRLWQCAQGHASKRASAWRESPEETGGFRSAPLGVRLIVTRAAAEGSATRLVTTTLAALRAGGLVGNLQVCGVVAGELLHERHLSTAHGPLP